MPVRKNYRWGLLIAVAGTLLAGCAGWKSGKKDIDRLAAYMAGDFKSEEPSRRSHRAGYHDIRLHIRRIWRRDKTARWLYVEQALYALEQERNPFRQRVYKLYKYDDKDVRIFCDLYEVIGLPEEAMYKKLEYFDGLYKILESPRREFVDTTRLIKLDSCSFQFLPNGDFFKGQMRYGRRGNCREGGENERHIQSSNIAVYPKKIESKDVARTVRGNDVLWGPESTSHYIKQ